MLQNILASMASPETINSFASIKITFTVSKMQKYKSALMFILLHKAQVTTHLGIDDAFSNLSELSYTERQNGIY